VGKEGLGCSVVAHSSEERSDRARNLAGPFGQVLPSEAQQLPSVDRRQPITSSVSLEGLHLCVPASRIPLDGHPLIWVGGIEALLRIWVEYSISGSGRRASLMVASPKISSLLALLFGIDRRSSIRPRSTAEPGFPLRMTIDATPCTSSMVTRFEAMRSSRIIAR